QSKNTSGTFVGEGATDPTYSIEVGDTINYKIVVKTGGNTPQDITFTDGKCDKDTLEYTIGATTTAYTTKLVAVPAGTTITFACDHKALLADGDTVINKASVVGHSNLIATDTKADDTVTANVFHTGIALDKLESKNGTDFVGALNGTLTPNFNVEVGNTVTYKVLVTTSGNTAQDVTFTDGKCDTGTITYKIGNTAPAAYTTKLLAVPAGSEITFLCTHKVLLTDADTLINEASVVGHSALIATDTKADDTVTANVFHTGIALDKLQAKNASGTFVGEGATDPTFNVEVGDTITYKVLVTTSGNTAQDVTFTDGKCDADTITYKIGNTAPAAYTTKLLAVPAGSDITFLCTHKVLLTDADTLINEASVVGHSNLIATDTKADDTVTANVHIPKLDVEKTQRIKGSGAAFADTIGTPIYAGDTIEYEITVRNTGDVALTATLSDIDGDSSAVPTPSGCDATPTLDTGSLTPLAVGASAVLHCEHVTTIADANGTGGLVTNTAIANGTDLDTANAPHVAPEDRDTVSARVLVTLIRMDKMVFDAETGTWTKSNRAHVGDTIKYTITVANDGNNPLDFDLVDAKCATTWTSEAVTTGNFKVYTCEHVILDTDANPYINTAVLDGTDEGGTAVHRESSATTTILKPAFTLDKLVRTAGTGAAFSKTNSAHVGDTLEYQITVANTGNTTLTFDLLDPNCGTLSSTSPAGLDGVDDVIGVAATATYVCTHVITALDANPYLNTVRATGTDGLGLETTKESSANTAILIPGLAVDKQVRDVTRNTPFVDTVDANIGDTLEYRINYTNTGNVALALTVRDDKCSPLVAPAGWSGTLGIGATASFTCTRVYVAADPSPFVNVASGTGTDILGGTVTTSDTATVVELPIEVAAPKPRAASRLVPPSGCQRGVFRPYVTGQNIRLVQYYVDGKLAATVRKASSGKWVARLTTTKLRAGVHRLVVKVTYTAATGTAPRTIRSTFGVCRPRVVLPAFTG
ncbi:MAG: conserved repeat domain protein, partial [Thermoleophilia bacterium]|nr:conserved repeat domain protein [Thermoleophilia bacterium]